MHPQVKDKLYDIFLKEPIKDNFSSFVKSNCGEFDEIDYKKEWPDKGKLSRIILAMANKKFQVLVIYDTPERLPFISLGKQQDWKRIVSMCREKQNVKKQQL